MHMRLLLAFTPLLAMADAWAACAFIPGAGDDAYHCDSGEATSLVDLSGDNRLTLPAGGSGAISGDVIFGAGDDRVDMASGSIGGDVDQGTGSDHFSMSGGIIQGDLNQGDGLDTFRMTGGWIKGTFDSGDHAEMDGGRIGSVNMRLDQNVFILRGGSIDRNIVSAFDKDHVEVFDGTVGGNISVSGGDDQVLIHGGRIGGDVLLSTGNDLFSWDGGRIGGRVDLGPGNDTARLAGLSGDAASIPLDGGTGIDTLTLLGSHASGGARLINWERIALSEGSRLDLDDTLRLGDPGSGAGTVLIDAQSTLVSRQGSVVASANGQPAVLENAGTIDLRGGNDARGRLTIAGHYNGDNGNLHLNSVLADDDAASDRLVVSQGSIGGHTQLLVDNLGGTGAATQGNGILVVEARDGAVSDAGNFVQGQVLSAGAYDYRLFRGGLEAGSENNWYLRSAVIAPRSLLATASPPDTPVAESPQAPAPSSPAVTVPQAAPAPGQVPLPSPVPGRNIPLYRPEVPVYAAAPRGAAIIVRQTLGTFHQRQGDQRTFGAGSAGWGQAYADHMRQQWSGTVSPRLEGHNNGWRVGHDLHADVDEAGYRQQVGLYLGHGRLDADVKGFALAREDQAVGDLELVGKSAGVYWTQVSPAQGYLDVVLQYTVLDGRARSDRGGKLDIDGHAWSASLEGGYPFALSPHWFLEPQAQLIAQQVTLDSASDSVAQVNHDAQLELTGRIGLRLEGTFQASAGQTLHPYVEANLWHGDGGRDTLTFDGGDRIKTDYRFTALQVEAGLATRLSAALSLHGGVQYSTNLDSRQQQAGGVNAGLRWQF
ncbi:autotransporter outer membrane beta-barrel domain-containing protein [Pseudomonas sp. UFMG81]|uniref:autotransporter outer membrane beta-barrel domain-containing protein n=1 Tax=Pseudomonas sp. UFMG81 TaxID=2745936 RepID=UPI00188DD82C|nr:autotransporter outer membrane beta-barrel domain-containing protein [Pseudomonas sp. UFMG81]